MADLTYEQAEDAVDALHVQVVDADVRRLMLAALLASLQFVSKMAPQEMDNLRAYARAAGM